jgi:aryl-alcohol dehydrogenase-like predicted oxidoreductase
LSRNHITSVILGPRTLQQFKDSMAGFDLLLPPEIIKRLSDASKSASDGLRAAAARGTAA